MTFAHADFLLFFDEMRTLTWMCIRARSWVGLLAIAVVLLLPGTVVAAPTCAVSTGANLQSVISRCTNVGKQPATVAIQAHATISVRGTVSLPSNLEIRCDSGAAIRATSRGVPLLSVENASGISIEGCTLNGNRLATNAVYISKAENVHLDRLTVGGLTGAAIYGAFWHNVEIEHSVFGTAALGGWQPGNIGAVLLQAQSGESDHISIHHNRCNGNFSHSSCFKLAASDSSLIQWIDISHNTIVVGDCSLILGGCAATPGGGELGIELFSTTSADDTANAYFTIADNLVHAEDSLPENNAFCISLGGARYGSVTGNVAKDCQALGIEIIASYVSVSNNILHDTGPISWDANTIPHADVVISQNVIVNPVCRGIFLIATPPNSLATGTIVANTIRGPIRSCGKDGPPPAALRIQSNGGNIAAVRVAENAVEGVSTGTNAIETFGGTQIEIEQNRFENNHGVALNLASDGTQFSIKDNRFNGDGTFLSNHGTALSRFGPNFVNGSAQ